MKEIFSDFTALKQFTKGSGLKFHDALIEFYTQLGEKHGFTVVRDASVIANAHHFGMVDLVWMEPNIAFQQEFGLLDDIYRHLWRLSIIRPAIAVLLLSGNSQCSPQKVKEIAAKSPQLKGIDFVVLDVTRSRVV